MGRVYQPSSRYTVPQKRDIHSQATELEERTCLLQEAHLRRIMKMIPDRRGLTVQERDLHQDLEYAILLLSSSNTHP
jgi:hypothetical protein